VSLNVVFDRLQHWASRSPDRLLYAFLNSSGEPTESYSYQAFLERTNVIAAHLLGEHKCGPADRLLLCYPPGLEMLCAFFGAVRAGLIPVPVYPPNAHGFEAALYKLTHIAKDCGASGVLTSRNYYASLKRKLAKGAPAGSPPERDQLGHLKWIVTEDLGESPGRELVANDAHDVLFIQYTSGSTSEPKGVAVSHENILHNCGLVMDHPRPVVVSWLPQYHDMGLIGSYLNAALSGGTTYGFSPLAFIQRPAVWFEAIKTHAATASSAPNFAFDYCLRPGRLSEEALANVDLSSLHFLIAAAEPVKPATYLRFLEVFEPHGLKPERFFVAYGLAENTLALSNRGTTVLSVNKKALSQRRVRVTSEISEISGSTRIVSCGKSIGDQTLRIVDTETQRSLPEGKVGEIWVDGPSKCLGYWNNPALTQATFRARIAGESEAGEYLRTGDLGFVHHGELYVCGRIKDTIIIRGQNYYPQDVENIVEDASPLIRKSCVAAFEIDQGQGPELAVIAEVQSPNALPDARDLVTAIRKYLNLETAVLSLVAPRSVPKTSSGKISRQLAKQMWLNGNFNVLCTLSRGNAPAEAQAERRRGRFDEFTSRYNLRGDETQSLVELGVDSLDLVLLLHEITEMLKENGAEVTADHVDVALIQHIKVSELLRLADLFEHFPETARLHVRQSLEELREHHRRREAALMGADRHLMFHPSRVPEPQRRAPGGIFLTGGTGFLGPFLLKSLLEQSAERIFVLVRASDPTRALERLKAALQASGLGAQTFDERVVPICGDLALPNLGLTRDRWEALANGVDTIYHNGAMVNYVFNYEAARAANVLGTSDVLRLAFDGRPKTLNHMSTTFVFGWTVKPALYESDSNEQMEALDFGYSQSKWVAEQLVRDAARNGLAVRVFRPSLVSPSRVGGGDNLDIAMRLLAFMVKHGIGVDTPNQVSFVPADVAANNIVAIASQPATRGSTYHVTRDEYSNMMDVTNAITELTGRRFQLFTLKDFVPEIIRRCTRDDALFPLLDFLSGSVDRIAAMEAKRYDNAQYRAARDNSPFGIQDPSLDETVYGIVRFLEDKGLVRLREPRLVARAS